MRFGAAFVAVCMALISLSLGGALYLSLGFSGSEATIAAVAALSALALVNAVTRRGSDRADVATQVADLAGGIAGLARQVGEVGRRLVTLEGNVADMAAKARAAREPLAGEITELSLVVKEIADSVATHEQLLGGSQRAFLAPEARRPAAPETEAPAWREPPSPEKSAESERLPGVAEERVLAMIRRAVEDNRIDLYLQPIVTLPQRKVRYYEALTRLRGDDGEVFAAADFAPAAEAAGLALAIDKAILFRCLQVVRRLQTRNRDVGLFCNLSASTLNSAQVFAELVHFLEGNKDLARSIVLEFAQSAVRGMGPIEHASLAALAEMGFRFSLDGLADLHIEPREIAERGFRFVKAPAALLLRRAGQASDIHPADFSGLLGRFGVELIAEDVENEATVVDLLDYDLRFGQGSLFSPPRPVRSDVLQSMPDRTQPVTVRTPVDLPPVRGPDPLKDAPAAVERGSSMARLARTTVRRA